MLVIAAAAALGAAGCGGGTVSTEPTAEEAALARRVADEVYERLRQEGVLDSCAAESADDDEPRQSAETAP